VTKTNFRILGIGDSFFVGHEVSLENSALRQLEKSLDLEVIKMAVVNYGTIQERLLWEEEGKKYQPDVVLLGVFVGNDLGDNVAFPNRRCVDEGHFVRCGDASSDMVQGAQFLAKHSLLARFLLQRFHHFFPKKVTKTSVSVKKKEEEPLFKNLNRRDGIYLKDWSARLMRGYDLLEENILQLDESVSNEQSV